MGSSTHCKDGLSVYTDDPKASRVPLPMASPVPNVTRARRHCSARKATLIMVAIAALFVLAMDLCNTVKHQLKYYQLVDDYNGLLLAFQSMENATQHAVQDAHLARRDLEANSALITTTTTVTQATTVTLETTAASSSSIPASPSSFSAGHNATSSAGGACGTGSAPTVTVTVTAQPSFSVVGGTPIASTAPQASFVSFSITSSMAPVTVVETQVTTATVIVTASGHTTPKPETQTFTATATEDQTATEIITVHPGGANHTVTGTGTSTSTADAVFGTGSHTARYPNSTLSLTPYGTASGGGLFSTASFTLTVPAGHTGGTDGLSTPLSTTTSQADPASTIVTVSGASKMSSACGTIAVSAVIAFALFF